MRVFFVLPKILKLPHELMSSRGHSTKLPDVGAIFSDRLLDESLHMQMALHGLVRPPKELMFGSAWCIASAHIGFVDDNLNQKTSEDPWKTPLGRPLEVGDPVEPNANKCTNNAEID